MKITFATAGFAAAAKAVRDIPDSSVKIDILDHARLHFAEGRLSLTMSDLDIEGRASIEAAGDGETVSAIPRAVLDFFTGRAAAGEGSLEFDERDVTARCGKARMKLPTLPGADFPVFDSFRTDWSFKIRAHEFCRMMKVCEKAVEPAGGARPYLNGVFLHLVATDLAAVATDGHRLHWIGLDAPEMTGALPRRGGHADELAGVIIPQNAVAEIIRMFDGDESEVAVSGSAAKIMIEGEQLQIASKLVDGTFPHYPRIIPEPGGFRLRLPGKALETAIAGLMVIPKTEGKGKPARIRPVRLTPEDGAILLEMKGDMGEIEDRIAAEIEGDGPPVIMNARLICDAIAAAGPENHVTIAPGDGAAATAVRVLAGDGAKFIVMQMHF